MITKFLKSVKYALKGIYLGITEERNMRIDIIAMMFVWFHMQFYSFTKGEKALLILVTFLIPAFELMNTAVERAVHKPDREHYMPAGDAKDTAAGAVFIATLGAVAVAAVMFWDISVIVEIINFYTSDILHLIGLLAYTVFAYIFITIDNFTKKDK